MPTQEATAKAAEAARDGIASLLKTAKYSDLTLICRNKAFKVHRTILCPRSTVIAAACDGPFQEAQTRELKVQDTDVEALKRLILFLYTGDYSDSEVDQSFFTLSESIAAETVEDEAEEEDGADETTAPKSENNSIDDDDFRVPEFVKNDLVVRNACVYALADYYDISDLKNIAAQKFRDRVDEHSQWDQSKFINVVSQVYDLTRHRDPLRVKICEEAANHRQTLTDDQNFLSEAATIPQFMQDFAREMVWAYEREIVEHSEQAMEQRAVLERKVSEQAAEIDQIKAYAAKADRYDKLELRLEALAEHEECRNCPNKVLRLEKTSGRQWILRCSSPTCKAKHAF